ncbi:hypothetical protein AB0M12_40180, partial [Nocardia vinacea]|uniref:hypothetical protein n=1 Tax=Nocardia vinacea TaxID=96468 RepID=UPI003430A8E2
LTADHGPTPDRHTPVDCPKCGTPLCLALVRAETPPTNWLDFLDRKSLLLSSGHWGWRQIGYLAALTGIGVFAVAMLFGLCAVAGPIWTGALGGGAGVSTGVGLLVRRHLRKKGEATAVTDTHAGQLPQTSRRISTSAPTRPGPARPQTSRRGSRGRRRSAGNDRLWGADRR